MQLEPATTTNPKGTGFSSSQDPGSGTISVADNTAHVVVTGGMTNATYSITDCYMGGSSCFADGLLTTDASGNGTADVKLDAVNSAVLTVARAAADSSPGGFVTGFKVP